MKNRFILVGVGILLIAVASYFTLFRGTRPKYEFRMEKVSSGDVTMMVTATGTVNPVTSVDVGTQVSGIVAKLYADFNSVVKAGQVIAQIDPTFLQQSVKDAEANLDKARAQFADTRRALERTKTLYQKNLESQLTYDAAVTSFETSQAVLKQAQASLDRAKINLAYATIYAPINGVVIDRKVNVGQTVAASFSSPTLYTIANDLGKMQVQTTVDESDIGRISIGQEATFSVDAYPEEQFAGVVSQIRLAPVTVQNVVNYTVIINVDNKDLKLMPGMTANVKVMVGSARSVLRVPNLALRFQPPADLVDSAAIATAREGSGMRGGQAGDTSRAGSGGPWAGGAGSDTRRQRFQAVRDSINRAHGGSMERDELVAEVRKVMGFTGSGGGARAGRPGGGPAARLVMPNESTAAYGITRSYPEYQKSASAVPRESGRGRLWVAGPAGKLTPLFVRTGLTDGKFTEVTTDALKPGDEVVLGVTSNEPAAEQARSPLTGGGGPGGRGGMGGGGMR